MSTNQKNYSSIPYIIYFDIDETLVYARYKCENCDGCTSCIKLRPGTNILFKTLKETEDYIIPIIWTAGTEEYAYKVVQYIYNTYPDYKNIFKKIIHRDSTINGKKWYKSNNGEKRRINSNENIKDISLFENEPGRSLILDNSLYMINCDSNKNASILITDYDYNLVENTDNSIRNPMIYMSKFILYISTNMQYNIAHLLKKSDLIESYIIKRQDEGYIKWYMLKCDVPLINYKYTYIFNKKKPKSKMYLYEEDDMIWTVTIMSTYKDTCNIRIHDKIFKTLYHKDINKLIEIPNYFKLIE